MKVYNIARNLNNFGDNMPLCVLTSFSFLLTLLLSRLFRSWRLFVYAWTLSCFFSLLVLAIDGLGIPMKIADSFDWHWLNLVIPILGVTVLILFFLGALIRMLWPTKIISYLGRRFRFILWEIRLALTSNNKDTQQNLPVLYGQLPHFRNSWAKFKGWLKRRGFELMKHLSYDWISFIIYFILGSWLLKLGPFRRIASIFKFI